MKSTSAVTIGSHLVNIVEPEFLSFTCDFHVPSTPCAWDGKMCWAPNASFLIADTTHPRLRQAAKHLSPAILRVGGSPGDRTTYEFGSTSCKKGDFYCLRKAQWDGWQELARDANIRIMFGLNFLGRVNNGKWDAKNARELITYTYSKYGGKPPIFGFELGNELSARGPKAEDVVTGFRELRGIVQNLSLGQPPKIAGPACGDGGPHNPAWIEQFMKNGGRELIDVATYHWYVTPGTDKTLPADVLTTKWMDAEVTKTEQTKKQFDSWAPGVPLWQGEGALAADSGQDGLTNRFEDTLWYIVRLGALAANGHAVWNRQTLIGGYYSLFDQKTLRPHPDWWAAVLHKRLMGTRVLHATSSEASVYSFAHCTAGGAPAGAVTVALVNLLSSQLSISFNGVGSSSSQDQYCLTASKLSSDFVKLNGGADVRRVTSNPRGHILKLSPQSYFTSSRPPTAHVCLVLTKLA